MLSNVQPPNRVLAGENTNTQKGKQECCPFIYLDFLVEYKCLIIILMAKRATGVGKRKKIRSHKTKKRLAIKAEMLAVKASKKRN